MKKIKVLSVFALLGATFLVSCGGDKPSSSNNGSKEPTSTQATTEDKNTTSQATTEDRPVTSDKPTTEDKPTSDQPTTSEDPSTTSSETPVTSETPVEKNLEASIVVTGFNDDTPLASVKEGTGAYKLKVNVDKLPEGKTIDDCTFTLKSKTNAFAHYEAPTAAMNWAKNEFQFIVNFSGVEKIAVEVTCGEEKTLATLDFKIEKDETKYTTISTAEEFKNMIKAPAAGTLYQLGANIDLGGYSHDAYTINTVFNSVLDGNGYTVKNFTVTGCVSGNDTGIGSGLFRELGRSVIRNLHVQGNVNAPRGFGGLLAHTVQNQAVVEDCLFEATNTSTIAGDWAWQRNGVIAACNKGVIRNVVSINASDPAADATIKDQMISTVPYGYRNDNDVFELTNVYTNISNRDLAVPFDASGKQEWGMVTNTNEYIDVKLGFGDFTASKASDFTLDPTIWTLADGKMPTLAHYQA